MLFALNRVTMGQLDWKDLKAVEDHGFVDEPNGLFFFYDKNLLLKVYGSEELSLKVAKYVAIQKWDSVIL